MNNTYPYYLTIEEYTEAINAAHTDYLKSMHTSLNGSDMHHISDLAVSSSAFFESAYLVLDHISCAMHNKIERTRQDAIELSLKYLKDLEKDLGLDEDTDTETEIDEPLWHRPKKKFKKSKKSKKK